MGKTSEYDRQYDHAWFLAWEFTTAQATTREGCYEAANHFAGFCQQEMSRHFELEEIGETAIARRGLVSPLSMIRAWIFNVIEDCSQLDCPVPPDLLEVLYQALGCNHRENERKERKNQFAKSHVEWLREKGEIIRVRRLAEELNVDPATISRWAKAEDSPDEQRESDKWEFVRKQTQIFEFVNGLPRNRW